jgi:hypothetical protein
MVAELRHPGWRAHLFQILPAPPGLAFQVDIAALKVGKALRGDHPEQITMSSRPESDRCQDVLPSEPSPALPNCGLFVPLSSLAKPGNGINLANFESVRARPRGGRRVVNCCLRLLARKAVLVMERDYRPHRPRIWAGSGEPH